MGEFPLCSIKLVQYAICDGMAGESIPSIVVLWVMRDLPPKSRDNSLNGSVTSQDLLIDEALVPDAGLLPQWVVSAAGRPYLVLPACCNSDISPS